MDINTIIAYENGELDAAQVVELFQYLLDSGVIWHLQGSYGHFASFLLKQGLITNSPNHGARKRAKKRGAKANHNIHSSECSPHCARHYHDFSTNVETTENSQ